MSLTVPIIDSPMQLSSNFLLSCEANNLTGYNIGDSISGWTDNSGLNNHLIQTTASRRPSYDIDNLGFKYLKFTQTGLTSFVSTNSYAQQSNLTIVMAMRMDELVSSTFRQTFYTGSSPLTDRVEISAVALWLGYIISNTTTPSSFISANNAYPNINKAIVAIRRTPTLCETFINGTRVVNTPITSFTASTSPQQFQLQLQSLGGHYQIHVCAEALNNQKLKQLMRYSAFKSGIKI